MSDTQTNRVGVSFQVQHYPDGRPFITLVLNRSGDPVSTGGKLFTLDLVSNLTAEEASTLALALNQCVTHLGVTRSGSEEDASG